MPSWPSGSEWTPLPTGSRTSLRAWSLREPRPARPTRSSRSRAANLAANLAAKPAADRVAVVYLDTSVVGRLLLGEQDAPAIVRALASFDQHVSSRLLRVELRRLGLRFDRLADADRLLTGV